MIIIYALFIILFLFSNRFKIKGFNENYISKNSTTIINGLFVITVLFSHFNSYIIPSNIYDKCLVTILNSIGQLMVTSFLFYSGFGIYESIKNKKNYMKSFFKNRFLSTYFSFFVTVLLFLFINFILNNNYDIKTILLSFTGYESIGNSNWYMFCIFYLYIVTMICFCNSFKLSNIYRILLVSLLSIIYIAIITKFKSYYYASTILCYPFGMLYSYYKEKLWEYIKKYYYLILLMLIMIFAIGYYIVRQNSSIYLYNIYAIVFVLLVVFISMKLETNNKVYYWIGSNVFYIYMLQRIPMNIFKGHIKNNYLYFAIVLAMTVILSFLLNKIITFIQNKLFKKNKNG